MPVPTLFVREMKGALGEHRREMDRDRTSQRPVATRTIGDLSQHSQMYAYCNVCRHTAASWTSQRCASATARS
jgi:hypothetical protein